MMKNIIKLLFLVVLPLSLTGCGENKTDIVQTASISLNAEVVPLDPNATFTIVPTSFDKDGNKLENRTYSYHSSNGNVATVDENGVVTAIKAGYSTITCISDKQIASCLINVSGSDIPEVYSIAFSPESVKIKFGQSYTPTIVTYPEDATGMEYLWYSSDEEIATVSDGIIQAIKVGTCEVTAVFGLLTAKLSVSVVESGGDVFTISLNKENLGLLIDQEFDLVASCSEAATVTWSSENSGIASVESNGHVKANAKGTTVISAVANDQRASCTVTVTDGSSPGGDTNLEVYFYIDYNNVDEENPYFKLDWYVEVPFGLANKPIDPPTCPDPAFSKFMGWSAHTIIDNIPDDLWDFEKNFVANGSYVFVLYGIWIDE